ncbi:hypothetical protein [Candidatus Puniceispirillum sp.]|jgi:hypothetical protein|uniref:hypothetical protein n=1 Tax=Candidatus Puniceispirillum sp. TaxID=2026719 RepID=UPI002FCE6261
MGYRLSIWINLGFLLSLAVVTSLALSDHTLNPSDQMNAEPNNKTLKTPTIKQNQNIADAQDNPTKQPILQLTSLPKPPQTLWEEVVPPNLPIAAQTEPIAQKPDSENMKEKDQADSTFFKRALLPEKQKAKPIITVLASPAMPSATLISSPVITPTKNTAPIKRETLNIQPLRKTKIPATRPPEAPLMNKSKVVQKPSTIQVNPSTEDITIARRQIDMGEETPSLEFLWPTNQSSHSQIYHTLTQCLGMIVGHIDQTGQVALASGQANRRFNREIHSPLLRSFEQPITAHEVSLVAGLRNNVKGGNLIRIFRKNTDISLLAGLRNMIQNEGNMDQQNISGQIKAEYLLAHDGLFLDQVTHNGNPLHGRIRLYNGQCS